MESLPPIVVNVQEITRTGQSPLPVIQEKISQLELNQNLQVIAPFKPLPLISQLCRRGFSCLIESSGADRWSVTFSRKAADAQKEIELDMRNLEPPSPLEFALVVALELGKDEALVMHTRFRPVYLFERLENEGFAYDSTEKSSTHWVSRVWIDNQQQKDG